MNTILTDRQILQTIYDTYEHEFGRGSRRDPPQNLRPDEVLLLRASDIYVPIDFEVISARLHMRDQMVFGRLYYDLDRRYGYRQPDGTSVHLFTPVAGSDRQCVHFPLLAGVLAGLQEDYLKKRNATTISIVALVVSGMTLLFKAIGL